MWRAELLPTHTLTLTPTPSFRSFVISILVFYSLCFPYGYFFVDATFWSKFGVSFPWVTGPWLRSSCPSSRICQVCVCILESPYFDAICHVYSILRDMIEADNIHFIIISTMSGYDGSWQPTLVAWLRRLCDYPFGFSELWQWPVLVLSFQSSALLLPIPLLSSCILYLCLITTIRYSMLLMMNIFGILLGSTWGWLFGA